MRSVKYKSAEKQYLVPPTNVLLRGQAQCVGMVLVGSYYCQLLDV